MSLTQYLESQEDQDMTRLLNFTRTQERRREGIFFFCPGMNERGGIYSSGGVVYCRRQPKIKPILLKIYVVVRVRIVPTKSI